MEKTRCLLPVATQYTTECWLAVSLRTSSYFIHPCRVLPWIWQFDLARTALWYKVKFSYPRTHTAITLWKKIMEWKRMWDWDGRWSKQQGHTPQILPLFSANGFGRWQTTIALPYCHSKTHLKLCTTRINGIHYFNGFDGNVAPSNGGGRWTRWIKEPPL